MPIQLLDVVALTQDLPDKGLADGPVGTVVETQRPNVFEVEFCDNDGRSYALLAVRGEQLLVLHHHPVAAARARYDLASLANASDDIQQSAVH